MRFMAQFDLKSDIFMPNDAERHSIQSPSGDFLLSIREVISKKDNRLVTLRCNMVFESEALVHAQRDFTDRVLIVLDMMSLVSHAIFRFDRLHKIFDWTPDKAVRSGLIYVYDPPEATSDAVFEKESFEAANLLLHATVDKRLLSALRWFRLGILADTSEEQFQKFWFSLELMAQYKKTTEKVHDSCPKCFGALYCKTCDTYPVHRPYPRQAIESIWKALAPHEVELFQIVNRARNAMLHGEPPDVIEAMTGVPLHQLVDPFLPIRLSPTPTICSVSPWTAGKGRRRRIEEAIRLILVAHPVPWTQVCLTRRA